VPGWPASSARRIDKEEFFISNQRAFKWLKSQVNG